MVCPCKTNVQFQLLPLGYQRESCSLLYVSIRILNHLVVYPPLAKMVCPVIHFPSVHRKRTMGAMSLISVSRPPMPMLEVCVVSLAPIGTAGVLKSQRTSCGRRRHRRIPVGRRMLETFSGLSPGSVKMEKRRRTGIHGSRRDAVDAHTPS